ncbi:ArsR/SmtB family transcription factor [Salisediminibacterium selenitireducens]|uniref:Transcriptional regulator, ArsR family n=1 Tax=Bacillus selenitireducens (strain ATCC 700615 / DSM 15326 / MLS10) TaxID=439292 RepID=D6XY52_BACIE|nr:metalloregulator ArsR/SmtB family transcription factor [Salisediminibacterium selenitireducens]ADH98125.1 transcriptional regulator, ArsR family [[Bacillus] selenitireducens MLS10]
MQHPAITSKVSLYKMLADEKRINILRFLNEAGLCVCDLEALLGISQPAVSQHLRKLKQADIITSHKHDQWHIYSINDGYEHHQHLLHILNELPSAEKDVADITAQGIRSRCSIEITEIRFLEKKN